LAFALAIHAGQLFTGLRLDPAVLGNAHKLLVVCFVRILTRLSAWLRLLQSSMFVPKSLRTQDVRIEKKATKI